MHALFAQNTLSGDPLEGSIARVLDLVEALDGFGLVSHQVGSCRLPSKAPHFLGVGLVPLEVVHQVASTLLEVITRSDLSVFNLVSECVLDRLGSHKDAVVLVGRLGKAASVALSSDGLFDEDDGFKLDDLDYLLQ